MADTAALDAAPIAAALPTSRDDKALHRLIFVGIAVLLVAEGGLAFLGYSVKPPSPSWGLLVSENRERIQEAWWATIFPCIMLFMTVLSFNLIGDRLARRFDVREAAV